MTTNSHTTPAVFHVPERPFGPVDAMNRRAAATGSPGYAMATAHADYNGHHVTVTWNSYRKFYIAQYYWGERCVLARGDFQRCLDAALAEYERGALGCSVTIRPREDDTDARAICAADNRLLPGHEPEAREWYTWRHQVACEAVRDPQAPGRLTRVFDLPLLTASESLTEYEAAVTEKYGSVYVGTHDRRRVQK